MVTGASGFVGSHCVKLLLERGYNVRATVRDAHNSKSFFLKELVPTAADRLQLFSADLEVKLALQYVCWIVYV